MSRYTQGFYKPKNPQKYKGRADNIVYRSSWEYNFMRYLDLHPDVILWASEEQFTIVPYRDPVTGRMRRYFPDFWFQRKDKDGNVKTFMVEVKPTEQTKPPKKKYLKNGKPDRYYQKKLMTYATNKAKWEAARTVCEQKGWKFEILTEKHLKQG